MRPPLNGHRTALVSIHDVMPGTVSRVERIVRFLRDRGVSELTALVVPGEGWTRGHIRRLRAWQEGGIELAGHGWRHRVHRIQTIWHRVHEKAISREEAEHLSLSRKEAEIVIRRCHGWFADAGLEPPALYVPPAWAMGRVTAGHCRSLPFSLYETLSGVHDVRTGDHRWMPLLGYMGDTPIRTTVLRRVNAFNLGLPLPAIRIAVHPHDLDLPLRRDLARHLTRFRRFSTYRVHFGRTKALPHERSVRDRHPLSLSPRRSSRASTTEMRP